MSAITYHIAHSFGDQDILSDGPYLAMPYDAFSQTVKQALVDKKPGFAGITRHEGDRTTTIAYFDIPQQCRVCGCTQNEACYDEIADASCHWVSDDLCSACSPITLSGQTA